MRRSPATLQSDARSVTWCAMPRLAGPPNAERTDPSADDRQPGQRAESLGKHQQDDQESRGRGEKSGDDEWSDEPDGATFEGDRSVNVRRDHEDNRWSWVRGRLTADRHWTAGGA